MPLESAQHFAREVRLRRSAVPQSEMAALVLAITVFLLFVTLCLGQGFLDLGDGAKRVGALPLCHGLLELVHTVVSPARERRNSRIIGCYCTGAIEVVE